MADNPPLDLDTVWDEFHTAVNMTSQELGAWLRTNAAHEETEELPETLGQETGRRVLAILQKRRMDLTDRDIQVMYDVVDAVHRYRDGEEGPAAGSDEWRRELMAMGHDPLRPA